jgi:hypothetical protein
VRGHAIRVAHGCFPVLGRVEMGAMTGTCRVLAGATVAEARVFNHPLRPSAAAPSLSYECVTWMLGQAMLAPDLWDAIRTEFEPLTTLDYSGS